MVVPARLGMVPGYDAYLETCQLLGILMKKTKGVTLNGKFVIEHNIPIPSGKSTTGYSYTLRQLKVGDSVVLPIMSSTAASNYARHAFGGSGHAACRKVEGGTRIWRIK